MIGKAKAVNYGKNAIMYALNKDQGYILDRHGVSGSTMEEVKSNFKITQQYATRVKNKDLHLILSPNGKYNLNKQDLLELTQSFMKKMKLDQHQYIAVVHEDTQHKHIHILANRIDFKGNTYSDNFISLRAKKQAEILARERGMQTAYERMLEKNKLKKIELKKDRKMIKSIFDKVLKEHQPTDFGLYCSLMKKEGVLITPNLNKKNKIQGYRIDYKGVNLKASEVHKSLTLSKLQPILASFNLVKEKLIEKAIQSSKDHDFSL